MGIKNVTHLILRVKVSKNNVNHFKMQFEHETIYYKLTIPQALVLLEIEKYMDENNMVSMNFLNSMTFNLITSTLEKTIVELFNMSIIDYKMK
jgi:hypothetical protein